MNLFTGIGRLTRKPDIRYTNDSVVARYTLACDRRFKRDGEPTADFINCVCFGRSAEFAEKHLDKGTKIAITGHIQTGSYTNKEGQKVYTTDVIVDSQEFVESKSASQQNASQESAPAQKKPQEQAPAQADDFMSIEDGVADELPFA